MNTVFRALKSISLVAAVAAALTLVACGGDGSSGSVGAGGPIGAACTGSGCVELGTSGNYVILAKSGVTTLGSTKVTGNIGVSPAAATFITGFGLVADSSNQFSTSSLVNGAIFAANYAVPTPSNLTTAVTNMQTAYTTANGGPAGAACPGSGGFGGLTLVAGTYDCSTAVNIATDVTLDGPGVFIFRIKGTLTEAAAKHVILTGGALPENVFWVVAQNVSVGTTATMNGVILSYSTIALNTGSVLNGRALSQADVTLGASVTVTQP